jgi:hypothetical protein
MKKNSKKVAGVFGNLESGSIFVVIITHGYRFVRFSTFGFSFGVIALSSNCPLIFGSRKEPGVCLRCGKLGKTGRALLIYL